MYGLPFNWTGFQQPVLQRQVAWSHLAYPRIHSLRISFHRKPGRRRTIIRSSFFLGAPRESQSAGLSIGLERSRSGPLSQPPRCGSRLRFHLEEPVACNSEAERTPSVILARREHVRHSPVIEEDEDAVLEAGNSCELARRKIHRSRGCPYAVCRVK